MHKALTKSRQTLTQCFALPLSTYHHIWARAHPPTPHIKDLGPTTSAHPHEESSFQRESDDRQHRGLSVGFIVKQLCAIAQGAGWPPMWSKPPTHKRQHPCDSPLCLVAPFHLGQHASHQEHSICLNPVWCKRVSNGARMVVRVIQSKKPNED